MILTEKDLIKIALHESKDFSKTVRQYLYDISKERPLTEKEKALYDTTHQIHIRTNDALLILGKYIHE